MKGESRFGMMVVGMVLALVGSAAAGAEVPAPVELVVVVHEGEQAVEGLSVADFEVRQRGRKATVVDARMVTERQWMLFFDLASAGSTWIPDAQAAALDLVRRGFAETDRVGVAVHGVDGKLLLVHPTLDRSTVAEAVAAVGAGSRQSIPTPNADQVAAVAEQATADPGDLGEGYERGLTYSGQGRVTALAQSIQGLAGMLHASGGNNHIVVFSSGLDLSVALGNDRTRRLDAERAVSEAEASATGDLSRNNGPGFAMGHGAVEQTVLSATQEAARRGCTVHGVEFRSPPAEAPRWGRQGPDGLAFLAERTGGEVSRDPEDLASAFEGVLQRTRVAYRLSVRPAKLKSEGGFHPAKVKLVDSSYEVDAAPGFYVPTSGP